MLAWAVGEYDGPVAIRYPRGGEGVSSAQLPSNYMDATLVCHAQGQDITLLTYGSITGQVLQAAEILKDKGVKATVLRLQCLSHLPMEEIADKMSENAHIVVVEEVAAHSGIKEDICFSMQPIKKCRVDGLDLGHQYVTHGSMDALYKHRALDGQSIANYVMEVRSREN